MMLFKLIGRDYRANGLYLATSLGILFVLSGVLSFGVLGSESGPVNGEAESGFAVALPLFFLIAFLSTKMTSLLFLKVDEMSDTNTSVASLPVKRGEIVKASYASSAILTAVALTVLLLATLPAYLIQGESYPETFILLHYPAFWCIGLLVVWCSNSFSFPFYFRFGLTRGVFMVVVIQVLLAALMIAVVLNSDVEERVLDMAVTVLEWMDTLHIAVLGLGSLGLTLLLMWVSAMLSVKFYKIKDL